jgi:TatD DNase family protein
MLFAAHCHISDERFEGVRDELVKETEESGVRFLADVGSDLATSLKTVEAAKRYAVCWSVVGCHPHEAKDFSDEQLMRIRRLYLEEPKVVAIGEIGLDYHYDLSPRDIQQYWFARQLEAALEMDAPIVIHEREAFGDCYAILEKSGVFSKDRLNRFPKKPDGSPDARLMFHCFSGSAETAAQLVKQGVTLGICGPVTYKNNRRTVEVVEKTDLVHLTVETDSPYLAPEPMRGRTNKPAYVAYTARRVADIKGLDYEEVCGVTFENACRFFGIQSIKA